jgi:hypothetical protein
MQLEQKRGDDTEIATTTADCPEQVGMLVVSRRTVETYVSRVLSKLGLTSRSQIALWTRDKGLANRES